jgi:ZIP family zinc transporter
MSALFEVLLFSLLPVSGIIIGSLLAESMRTPRWLIGAALHATAGVAIALVSFDLVPRVLPVMPVWLMIVSFLFGAAVSVLLAQLLGSIRRRHHIRDTGAGMVYMAVLVDLTSDGLMVGTGAALTTQLGFLLAAAQSLANVPGGFASTSNFRDDGMPRRRRIILSVSMVIPALISASVGFLIMRELNPAAQSAVLMFFVGVLLLTTIEDVVPQGDEPNPSRWVSSMAFASGFCLLVILSSLLSVSVP